MPILAKSRNNYQQLDFMITLHLRFYAELNDFLPAENRAIRFAKTFAPKTAIKDVIESLGVPHTEVDLILVNGQSVNFNYQIQDKDDVAVYPVFETLDIKNVTHLRPQPLRKTKFILDVHLGKLARHLRLLGFDTMYDSQYTDKTIVQLSQKEHRIILTRDVGLLKNKVITHGYWLRNTDPDKQIEEVLTRFDLYQQCHPFTRCLECNGILETVEKAKIAEQLPPLTAEYYENFMQCSACQKVYWQGTHYDRLKQWIDKMLNK